MSELIDALRDGLKPPKKKAKRCSSPAGACLDAINAANARTERAIQGLRAIVALQPSEYVMPKDWHEQIDACKECKRWKDHPIQRGICDEHRRPLWAREDHDKAEVRAIGGRAKRIASDLLRDLDAKEGK